MPITVNLSGVDAWGSGDILPPGRHHVTIDSAEMRERDGRAEIEMEFRAIGGPHDGGTIRDWLYITPKSMGKVKALLEATRYPIVDGEFSLDERKLVGLQCMIVVRNETFDGKERAKVKGYAATDGDVPASSNASSGASTAAGANDGRDYPFAFPEFPLNSVDGRRFR